jgi:hypothetical protein
MIQKIAYSFGLKVNAEIYQNIAENIDFKVVQKVSQNQFQLESLLFGKGNLLEKETETNQKWKKEFDFLKTKFKISEQTFPVKFMRLMVSTSERYWLIRSNEYNIFSSDGSVLICLASWLILAPILRSSYIICTSVFDMLLPFKADSLIKEERDFPSSFER